MHPYNFYSVDTQISCVELCQQLDLCFNFQMFLHQVLQSHTCTCMNSFSWVDSCQVLFMFSIMCGQKCGPAHDILTMRLIKSLNFVAGAWWFFLHPILGWRWGGACAFQSRTDQYWGGAEQFPPAMAARDSAEKWQPLWSGGGRKCWSTPNELPPESRGRGEIPFLHCICSKDLIYLSFLFRQSICFCKV